MRMSPGGGGGLILGMSNWEEALEDPGHLSAGLGTPQSWRRRPSRGGSGINVDKWKLMDEEMDRKMFILTIRR